MAIFSMNIAKISKSKGQSAVSAAAYIHRTSYRSKEIGNTFSYPTATKERITELMMLPTNAPLEFEDPERLWNAVENVEKNSNALLARRIIIALPVELTEKQNIDLITRFCHENFTDKGMAADCVIHWKDGNPHAHILLTTRPFKENGTWAAKEKKVYALDEKGERIPLLNENGEQKRRKDGTRLWKRETVDAFAVNHTNMAEEWRKAWADMANKALEKYNISIDHRSYERQGVDVEPTVHHGGNPRLKALNEVIMAGRRKIERLLEQLKALNKKTENIKVTVPWRNFDASIGLLEWDGKSIFFSNEEYHRVDDGWNFEITLKNDELYRVKTKNGFIRISADEVRSLLDAELPPMEPQQRQPQRVVRQRQRDDDFEL